MGLFTRVFGKEDKEADKRAEKEIEQIKSGEIHKIYPILKPGDWVGIEAGCVKQTLFGTPEAPKLVAGFGYDAPTNFVFLMPSDLEGKDPNTILNEAYENLENFQQGFEESEMEHGKILTASGGDFSSEKILCNSHMMKAHELLGAEELLVSIPRRTCMMIVPRNSSDELIDTFVSLHNHTWEDDSYGNAPILNSLFVVANGDLKGIIPLDK